MNKFLAILLLTLPLSAQTINGVTGQSVSGVTSSPAYVTGGGTANAQTATYSPAISSWTPGLQLCWLPIAANTTSTPTFAPNGLAAKTITKNGTSALVASDITTTAIACGAYDGTGLQLQNPQTALVLQHDGTANGSQTKLNSKSGAGIAITDDGVGGLTWTVQTTTQAVIRGTSTGGSTSASSFTASLTSLTPPGGGGPVSAQAGDFTLACSGGAWSFVSVTPSGWTLVYDENSGANSTCYSKTLTSGDISTGTVTMTRSNTYAGTVTLIVFVGATGGIREIGHSNFTGSPTTQTLSTSSAVLSSDVGVLFSTTRNSSGASLSTSPGTSLQNPFFTDVESRLYDYAMPGGVTTFSFSDTTPGSNFTYGFVIVEGLTTVGTMSNPMTTVGDLIVGGTGGTPTRAAAGTASTIWTSNGPGTAPSWQPAPGGGGALSLIQTLTPTGTGTVTFSSLGSYRDLIVVVRGASTASASFSEVHLQFNADTGSNYDMQPITVNNASLGSTPVLAGTYIQIGWVPAATGVANMGAASECTIFDYAGTTFQKAIEARSGIKLSNAVSNFYKMDNTGWWRNTAAITSVTVFLDSGNYATGSSVSLYGRN